MQGSLFPFAILNISPNTIFSRKKSIRCRIHSYLLHFWLLKFFIIIKYIQTFDYCLQIYFFPLLKMSPNIMFSRKSIGCRIHSYLLHFWLLPLTFLPTSMSINGGHQMEIYIFTRISTFCIFWIFSYIHMYFCIFWTHIYEYVFFDTSL